jgi:hypothetical protein
MKLQQGSWKQPEVAEFNCSLIMQSAWNRYSTIEQNKENILNAWPLMFKTAKATGNFKLLGRMAPIIQRLKKDIIHPTDTWFYSFLLMIEGEEIMHKGFRRQRYIVKGKY